MGIKICYVTHGGNANTARGIESALTKHREELASLLAQRAIERAAAFRGRPEEKLCSKERKELKISLECINDCMPDPVARNTGGCLQGAKLHLWCARNGFYKVIDWLTWLGTLFSPCQTNSIAQQLESRFIEKEGEIPDMLVCVSPMITASLMAVAVKYKIPLMIMSADFNNTLYSKGWPEGEELPPCRYLLPWKAYEVAATTDPTVKPGVVRITGYPVREEFKDKNLKSPEKIAEFKSELHIPEGKKNITITMGSLGSSITIEYLEAIIRYFAKKDEGKDLHFTVCTGANEKLHQQAERLLNKYGYCQNDFNEEEINVRYDNPHNYRPSFTILGYTKRMHKVLAVSDAVFTKPGPGSIAEAVELDIPMICDDAKGHLPWEGLNLDLIRIYGLGEVCKKVRDFPVLLKKVLEGSEKYTTGIQNFKDQRPEQGNFADRIVDITKELAQQKVDPRPYEATPLWKKCLKVASLIISFIFKMIFYPFFLFINYSFFSGFYFTKHETLVSRKKELLAKEGNRTIEDVYSAENNRPVDSVLVKGTGDENAPIVIQALTKPYQYYHPRNYQDLLNAGMDVVMFNPSSLDAPSYKEDLKALVRKLKEENPGRKIAIQSYCISASISPVAVAELKEEDNLEVPLVLDRGYLNASKVASKFSYGFSWFFQSHLSYYYEVDTGTALEKLKDREILFICGTKDRFLKDRTRRMHGLWKRVSSFSASREIVENEGGHWTRLTPQTNQRVVEFFRQHLLPC